MLCNTTQVAALSFLHNYNYTQGRLVLCNTTQVATLALFEYTQGRFVSVTLTTQVGGLVLSAERKTTQGRFVLCNTTQVGALFAQFNWGFACHRVTLEEGGVDLFSCLNTDRYRYSGRNTRYTRQVQEN